MRKKILGMFVMVFIAAMALGVSTKAATHIMGLKQIDDGIDSVELEWKPQPNQANTDYYAEISTNPKSGFVLAAKQYNERTNSLVINGLKAGATYYVRVYGVTEAEEGMTYTSDYSEVLEVVTAPNPSKAKNTIKHTKSTVNSISLSWKAMPGANMYRVKYYPQNMEDKEKEKFVTKTSITLTKLKKNTRYDIEVLPLRKSVKTGYKAIDEDHTGKIISGRPVLPTKITGIKLQPTFKNPNVIGMSAKLVSKNKVSIFCKDKGADGYEVQLYTSYMKKNKCLKTIRINSNKVKYTNAGVELKVSYPALKDNKIFKVRVRGYILNSDKKRKYGEWSDWKNYTHCAAKVNSMMYRVNDITPQNAKVTLTWEKVTGAKEYAVYVSTKPNSGYKKYATVKGTAATITLKKFNVLGKADSKRYYIRIKPRYKAGKKWYTAETFEAVTIYMNKKITVMNTNAVMPILGEDEIIFGF